VVAAGAVLAQVVRVLAAQARELVRAAPPAERVRAPQPEELTRALEASAREDDPPTRAGRPTPMLIGRPFRESRLRRDRGMPRLLRELTGRLLRA
jgi:hypothetical protein